MCPPLTFKKKISASLLVPCEYIKDVPSYLKFALFPISRTAFLADYNKIIQMWPPLYLKKNLVRVCFCPVSIYKVYQFI